ncbi:MAG: PilN domain-containing protein [Legionella sp.]|nr:PilN domain-containing protein [Legionella sp.]
MNKINLFPWRELKRQENNKKFMLCCLASLIIAIILLIAMHVCLNHYKSYQIERNRLLQKEITVLNLRLAKFKPLKKLKTKVHSGLILLQELQFSRILMTHLLDELVQVLPEGVTITQLEKQKKTFFLKAVAKSPSAMTSVMRNIERSDWLFEPNIAEVTHQSQHDFLAGNDFILKFKLGLKRMNDA